MDIDLPTHHQNLEDMEEEEMEDERMLTGTAIAVLLLDAIEAHRLRTERRKPSRLYLCRPQLLRNPQGSLPDRSSTGAKSTVRTSPRWASIPPLSTPDARAQSCGHLLVRLRGPRASDRDGHGPRGANAGGSWMRETRYCYVSKAVTYVTCTESGEIVGGRSPNPFI